MKTTKKLLLLCLFGMMGIGASAFEVDEYPGYVFDFLDNDRVYISSYYSNIGYISIPSTITYKGISYTVTAIGERAFSNVYVEQINIPSSITLIEDLAFYGCYGLFNVWLPNSLSEIGNGIFQDCSSLRKIIIPNTIKKIGNNAFSGCQSLTDISIGSSVTSIGSRAFHGCSSLTNIVIPNTVSNIGELAFSNCSALESVSLSNAITTIKANVFRDCICLTDIVIPNSVTCIENSAFFNCSELKSILIPNSVTTIEDAAFFQCYSLSNIVIGSSVISIGSGSFCTIGRWTSNVDIIFMSDTPPRGIEMGTSFSVWNNTTKMTFQVPEGCISAYTNALRNYGNNCNIIENNYNVYCVDAEGKHNFLLLDYNDTENNNMILKDDYKSIVIKEEIFLQHISYERNFGNTNWQSLYVPFEITITDDLLSDFEFAYINGAKLYDYDDDGTSDEAKIEVFKMKKGTLLANTPYLIRAKTTGTKTITVNEATLYATEENSIDCSTTSLLFTFTGSYSSLGYDDIGGCYLLGGGTWNPVREGGSMKPMRFYLKIDSRDFTPFKAPIIRMTVFGEDGEATEIEASPISSPEGKELIFDPQGRRVEHPERGIYIINGKKVLVQ